MSRLRPGPRNAITDVARIEVGHSSESEALTGVTVVLLGVGAVTGVDVRGAAPGTRETDLLEPGNLVQHAQAIVLAGGSAFGLDAASGVMRFLEERGLGQPVGGGRVVPIVPAAVIFDLEVGDPAGRPSPEHGYRAALDAEAATAGGMLQGNAGVGIGARAGGLKGGLGSASSIMSNGLIVGALAVVNSFGRPYDPATGELYGRDHELAGEFEIGRGGRRAAPRPELGAEERDSADPDYARLFASTGALAGRNTTLGVVATNASLDKAQARKLAQAAHAGLARAIRPSHTLFDGDTIFGVGMGDRELDGPGELARLGAIAADTFARAVVHGVLAARSAGGLLCYRDAFPPEAGSGA